MSFQDQEIFNEVKAVEKITVSTSVVTKNLAYGKYSFELVKGNTYISVDGNNPTLSSPKFSGILNVRADMNRSFKFISDSIGAEINLWSYYE